jgi:uncharacterized protein
MSMQLTLHHTPGTVAVRSVDESGLRVGDQRFSSSVLLLPDAVHPDWPVKHVSELGEEQAAALAELNPEVVIVGTGDRLEFGHPRFSAALTRSGIGVEFMDNRAACRTFNVLTAEDRRVLAAIIQSQPSRD